MTKMEAPQVVCNVQNCVALMTAAAPITRGNAIDILRSLVRNGWIVAPMEPTNSMFEAYMTALHHPPVTRQSVVANIGKARKRWKAMAAAGMNVAFSKKVMAP